MIPKAPDAYDEPCCGAPAEWQCGELRLNASVVQRPVEMLVEHDHLLTAASVTGKRALERIQACGGLRMSDAAASSDSRDIRVDSVPLEK
jgi:hypothetical protein